MKHRCIMHHMAAACSHCCSAVATMPLLLRTGWAHSAVEAISAGWAYAVIDRRGAWLGGLVAGAALAGEQAANGAVAAWAGGPGRVLAGRAGGARSQGAIAAAGSCSSRALAVVS